MSFCGDMIYREVFMRSNFKSIRFLLDSTKIVQVLQPYNNVENERFVNFKFKFKIDLLTSAYPLMDARCRHKVIRLVIS